MVPRISVSAATMTCLVVGTLLVSLWPAHQAIAAAASNDADTDAREPNGPANPFGGMGLGNFGGDGLTNMFKGMTDLTGLVNSFSGAPKQLIGMGNTVPEKSSAKKADMKKEGAGFMGISDPMDFFKMMLNPMDFMSRLAKEFKLDRSELTQAVGRGMNFGLETALQPPMVCIRVVEKVFVPDSCQLKFICEMGKQLAMFKGQVPKLPDSYFEGASTAKALFDGASGRECEYVYACQEGDGPKLKKEFAGLKNKNSGGSGHQDSADYAASQQSKVIAAMPKHK